MANTGGQRAEMASQGRRIPIEREMRSVPQDVKTRADDPDRFFELDYAPILLHSGITSQPAEKPDPSEVADSMPAVFAASIS